MYYGTLKMNEIYFEKVFFDNTLKREDKSIFFSKYN
jgi:hypothetical protein